MFSKNFLFRALYWWGSKFCCYKSAVQKIMKTTINLQETFRKVRSYPVTKMSYIFSGQYNSFHHFLLHVCIGILVLITSSCSAKKQKVLSKMVTAQNIFFKSRVNFSSFLFSQLQTIVSDFWSSSVQCTNVDEFLLRKKQTVCKIRQCLKQEFEAT